MWSRYNLTRLIHWMFSFWMYQGQIQGQMSNKVAEQPSTVAKQFWKNKLDTTTKSRPSRGFLFKKVTTPSNSPQRKLHFPEIPCVLPHDCHSLPSRPISRYPHRISHHTPCNSFPAKEWKQASPPKKVISPPPHCWWYTTSEGLPGDYS